MTLELFWRFMLISLLAFGGGQASLPLVERMAVAETGWVSASDFAAAIAFGYVTPGPVLILAAFVGFRAAGLVGALAATFGVFLVPWALAAATAQQLQRLMQSRWLRGFGRGAGPAAVGLLAVTAVAVSRQAFAAWPYPAIAGLSLFLALRTKIHPFLILAAATALGAVYGALGGAGL